LKNTLYATPSTIQRRYQVKPTPPNAAKLHSLKSRDQTEPSTKCCQSELPDEHSPNRAKRTKCCQSELPNEQTPIIEPSAKCGQCALPGEQLPNIEPTARSKAILQRRRCAVTLSHHRRVRPHACWGALSDGTLQLLALPAFPGHTHTVRGMHGSQILCSFKEAQAFYFY
jgi:hypothetical protein